MFGMFDFLTPVYHLSDPSFIKLVCVKNFDYFEDRRTLIDEKMDDLIGNSLVLLRGDKWRQMRATLSPAFTGSKMRQMFELLADCAEEIVSSLRKSTETDKDKLIREMKDFFTCYTNDVIATCAFGVKVNSIEDPKNDFYVAGKQISNFGSFKQMVKLVIIFSCKPIARFLSLSFIPKDLSMKFKSMVLDTMNYRKENNIFRPDMINMLMQNREGHVKLTQDEDKSKEVNDGFATVEESDIGQKTAIKREWNDNELIAQSFLFFLAGFDAPSTMLLFAAYEIMLNKDIQQKLYAEILETNEKYAPKRIDYDALQKMKYMDQVVCELLRKWPVPFTDRVCVKDCEIDFDDVKVKFGKGSTLWLPIFALHHDPKYFPNPDEFNPERFSDENKHEIVSGSYIPFGIGPRNCIGDINFYSNQFLITISI